MVILNLGVLTLRKNPDSLIVVTYPPARFNPKVLHLYQTYCYYQLIKFSPWNINDISELNNKDTAIQRYNDFYESENTSPEIRSMLQFSSTLNYRIIDERNAEPEEIEEEGSEKDDWMEVGVVMPIVNPIYNQLITKNHDWTKTRDKYGSEQLMYMVNWIINQKLAYMESDGKFF